MENEKWFFYLRALDSSPVNCNQNDDGSINKWTTESWVTQKEWMDGMWCKGADYDEEGVENGGILGFLYLEVIERALTKRGKHR